MHAVAAVYYSYKIQQGLLVLIKEAYKPLLSNTVNRLQYSILWKCIQLVFKPNLPVSDPWGWRGCQLFEPVQVPQNPKLYPFQNPGDGGDASSLNQLKSPKNPIYPFQIPGDGGDAISLTQLKSPKTSTFLTISDPWGWRGFQLFEPAKVHLKPLYL